MKAICTASIYNITKNKIYEIYETIEETSNKIFRIKNDIGEYQYYSDTFLKLITDRYFKYIGESNVNLTKNKIYQLIEFHTYDEDPCILGNNGMSIVDKKYCIDIQKDRITKLNKLGI